jgi:hypothetical protein
MRCTCKKEFRSYKCLQNHRAKCEYNTLSEGTKFIKCTCTA